MAHARHRHRTSEWRGRTVRDPAGEKIGTFGVVFLGRQTPAAAPEAVAHGPVRPQGELRPRWCGSRPADGRPASPVLEGRVKDAPQIDPEDRADRREEEALWRHYGEEYAHIAGDEPDVDTTGGAGLGDDAMTRSEEEVRVHEGPMRPAERVRLRKVLVTEHETRTVPSARRSSS
jgi:hypothetical protein